VELAIKILERARPGEWARERSCPHKVAGVTTSVGHSVAGPPRTWASQPLGWVGQASGAF